MTTSGVTGPDGMGPADASFAFIEVRPQLFGIAYRMLGSVAEAEDVLQEAWIRWHLTDRSAVRNPQAFLTTTTARLAINVLQSARTRRETYTGPWLPEPVDTSEDPALGAEQAEALDVAVLVLLERLTPAERAAYVLREAFGYAYADIARIVHLSQAAARQLVSRARKHIASGKRSTVVASKRRALLDAFVAAARAGDLAGLERLLADDVVRRADRGGAVRGRGSPSSAAARSHDCSRCTRQHSGRRDRVAVEGPRRDSDGSGTARRPALRADADRLGPRHGRGSVADEPGSARRAAIARRRPACVIPPGRTGSQPASSAPATS
ncbi:sigma-70 family RNA polymerase sigma factor [Promicromonospora vindobonensis]|uniref:Sigma-70 family RNA polymerase sigma factor n=1 Tax=Promicromonospora vindobonensis TaxID=195748 RepID=A0ABW5VVJ1_9MICO